ncbi:MAG: hypothetical protein GY804_01000 [Alphaproteobacteria bacterium]|nr:hypothetical protein [Alphaproteobacteria bacterium]
MSNLASLKPSILKLNKHEQYSLHEAIRVSRKVSKVQVVKKRKAVNRKVNKVNKAIGGMSPEQAQALLDRMKKEGRI